MQKPEKKDAGFNLDKEVMDAITERAACLGFSRSAMVNFVLRQYLGLIPDGMGLNQKGVN